LHRLFHWTLLPVERAPESIDAVFQSQFTDEGVEWLSVVEDRRTKDFSLGAVWLVGRPPR
jgi:hypothetical protein